MKLLLLLDAIDNVFEILKYIIPSIIVLITANMILLRFFEKEREQRMYEVRTKQLNHALPLRLQAYERLTLFLERISPSSLVHRVRTPEMTTKELHLAILTTVRKEYEHNLTQQIYVSQNAWDAVSIVKDEIIKVINLVAQSQGDNTSSRDFSKAIFEYFMNTKQTLPTQKGIDILKSEAQQLY